MYTFVYKNIQNVILYIKYSDYIYIYIYCFLMKKQDLNQQFSDTDLKTI